MKLTYALIFSVCAFTSTSLVPNHSFAAQASSGEVKHSNASLLQQLSQEKTKVSKLEAEVAVLHKTVDSLKALIGKIGDSASLSAKVLPSKYTIKSGETITLIANRHNISREQLMQMNGIGENQQIYIGDELLIPAPPASEIGETVVTTDTSTPKEKSKTKTQSAAPTPLAVVTTSTSTKKAPTPAKPTTIAWTQKEKTEPAKAENKKATTKQAPPAVIEVAKIEKPKAAKKTSQKENKPLTLAEFEKAVQTSTPKEKPEVAKVENKTVIEKIAPKQLAKTESTTANSSKASSEYTIKFGDNLGKIAKKHGITIGALMNFNNITNPDKISGGQKLKIPSKETAKTLSEVKPAANSNSTALTKNGDKPSAGDDLGIYTVQTGDTLYELARDFYTTQKELQRLNKMGNSSKIIPGQDLIVPTSEYFKKRDLATN